VNRIGLIGVGLLGGSIGLAIRVRWPQATVIGWSRQPASLEAALERSAIHRAAKAAEEAMQDCDLVVVSTPVDSIPPHVRQATRMIAAGGWVTDVGSTKESIVRSLEDDPTSLQRFIGSHPLAGSDKQGVRFARPDLFAGRTTVITPTPQTPAELTQRAIDFWTAIGAKPVAMDAPSHDLAIAATSHMPHLVAAALASSLPPELLPLVASGWRDSTRIAAGDPQLWRQIFQHNAVATLRELDRFARVVSAFRESLSAGDFDRLQALLADAQAVRQSAD
jgi:prephenate dehydrogenase